MTTTEVEIERIAQGGDGLGHLPDGRVVFVPGAFPGETVSIEVVRRKKSWARGRLAEVIEPSEHRLSDPGCPHASVCGGCSFRSLSYPEEFRAKVSAARDTLERIGKFVPPEGEAIASPSPDGYRVRARLHVHRGKTGYYESGSRNLFPLRECPALDQRLQAPLAGIVSALRMVERAEVTVETADEESCVVLLNSRRPVVDDVLDDLFGIEGVAGVRANDPSGTRQRGEPSVTTREAIGVASPVAMPPGLFRQANAQMNETLRELVRRRVGSGEHLVELFAGSGNFSFALASQFDRLDGFESSPDAVALGNEVASALEQAHVSFHTMDLEREHPTDLEGATVLLDPPRTGADAAVNHLGSAPSEKIVYVSCDPATLARDLRTLIGFGWTVETVDFVDMFPRTPHLETVTVLSGSGTSQ